MIPNPNQRFTKLDADGNALPNDATEHVAVLDTYPHPDGLWRVWAVESAVKRASSWDKCDKAAKDLRLLGADDWQLPTVDELFVIADRTRYSPAIDETFFPGARSDWYWTSTPAAYNQAASAWIVGFDGGYAHGLDRGGSAFARAVRRVSARQ